MIFSTHPCKFGYVCIVTTDGLLCGLELAETEPLVLFQALARFEKVRALKTFGRIKGYPLFDSILESVNENIACSAITFFLTGTKFQKKVWEELLKVPAGKTISYKEIAFNIGNPNAVRAVGTACGANPIAIIVPCHRAVSSSGKNSGYRWGIEIKKQLLAREA